MKPKSSQQAVDRRHEAKPRRLAKPIRDDPAWDQAHYLLEAKDNPRLKALNEALPKLARRKIN